MLIRNKRRKADAPELAWGKPDAKDPSLTMWWLGAFAIFLMFLAWAVWYSGKREQAAPKTSPPVVRDAFTASLADAEKVAVAFVAEADPEKRLRWVLNPQDVTLRMGDYPEEALRQVGEVDRVLGHHADGGRPVTGFVVRLPSGNVRLMELVGTQEGPKIDWDAYARHGTATWEDLVSGKVRQAVVRVFCEPATERLKPFADQAEWTCFRMSSPDLPQATLAYARVGTPREAKMKEAVLGTPKFRQRFTMEILRHDSGDEPVFEITRCLAVGWVVMGDLEEEWRESGE